MSKIHGSQKEQKHPPKNNGRGWGGRLKPHEIEKELSRDRGIRGEVNAPPVGRKERAHEGKSGDDGNFYENEIGAEERLALLHKGYFHREKETPATFSDIGLKSIDELRALFKRYDIARSKSNKKAYCPTAGPVALLLSVKN